MNNYYIALNDCKYINKLLNSLILNIDEKYIIDNSLDKEKIEDLLKVLLRNLTLFMCGIDRTSSREDLQFLLESGNFWATEFIDKTTVFEMLSKTLTDIRYNEKKSKEEFNKTYGIINNNPGIVWSIIFDLVDNSSNVTLSLRTLVVIYSLIEHYLTTLMSLDERISYSEKKFIIEYTQSIRESLVGRWPEYLSNFDFNKILTEINRLYDKSKKVDAYLKSNVLDSIYVKYINNTNLLIKHIPYENNDENVQILDDETISIIKEENIPSHSIKNNNIVSGNHYVQSQLPKTPPKKQEEEKVVVTETLEELLAQLNELIGLENIKKDINDMVNLIKIRNMRKENNLPVTDMSFHLVFTGNPGTGKTTIARLISKIYNKLGVVSKGQLVEVDRSGLIAGYVGQTAIKVKEKVDEAMGGVLFIDEAYTLTQDGESDFAEEAVATLLKYMEDYRNDLVVIVAGYTDLMKEFIASNPGLKSRFNKYFEFKDYTLEQLKDIFLLLCNKNQFTLEKDLHKVLMENIQKQIDKNKDTFGNARGIRNYFEKVLINQANRLTAETVDSISVDKLKEITDKDLIV